MVPIIRAHDWKVRVALVAVAGVAVTISGVFALASGQAAQSVPAKLWPAFTMTYTYEQFDSASGELRLSEVHRLTVKSEYDLRDDTVSDAFLGEAGSYRILQGGTLTSYDAKLKTTRTFPIGDNAIIALMHFIDADLLSRAEEGHAGPGWSVGARQNDTVSGEKTETTSCGSATSGFRQCDEVTKIVWRLPNSGFIGGIPTSAVRVVDGKLVERLTATSLAIQ